MMIFRPLRKNEIGATVAEFAVASAFFFMLILSIIEFGRLLYTHNALTDATRRGARYAALHTKNAACVRNIVIYGEKHVDSGCQPTGPPLVNGLNDAAVDIDVDYKGADLDNDPDDPIPIDTGFGTNLGTATVTIQGYMFEMGIPYIDLNIAMPDYRTTLSAESAGYEPEDK